MHRVLILAVLFTAPIEPAAALPAPAPLGPLAPAGPQAEEVTIETSDGLQLAADWYAPSKGKGLVPGALLVHDAGADRTQLSELAERLQKSGFGVLNVDLRGHGGSAAEGVNWDEMTEDERSSLWALATRDVEAASRWLLSREGVHSTNLSLIGVGSGCALAVRHAKRDENVRCVALLGPRSKDFGFDVAADLLKIEGLPTLVLAPRDEFQADTERMVTEANSDADPYVELVVAAPKVTRILDDRKVPSKVSSWVKGFAMPKKGRG